MIDVSFALCRSAPHIPEVHIPEKPVLAFASALRNEINRALAVLREIASGRDLKTFLLVRLSLHLRIQFSFNILFIGITFGVCCSIFI